MKFLSDILAKAGLTVDGVVTLNNTATGQTPNANDNSTKLATTAWVRTFVQPYSLPIASASTLGGIKVGDGLSIDSVTGVLSASVGGGNLNFRTIQEFTATAGQTTFTITGGYTPGYIEVLINGVYVSESEYTASNGTTVVLDNAVAHNDIVTVFLYSLYNLGSSNYARNISTLTATAGQTVFNVTYIPGQIDIFYNGSKLSSSEFTATNGTTVTLVQAAALGDILEVVTYLAGAGVNASRTLTINGVSYDLSADRSWIINNASLGAQPQLNGTGLVRMSGTTVSYDNATYATQTYVTTAVSNLVNAAPSTLDTLNELAAALGNDANFATTVTNSIASKQAQLNGTGFVKVTGTTVSYDNSTYLTTSSASSTYLALVGGALTGGLTGTTASFSSFITAQSTGGSGLRIYGSSGTNQWDLYLNSTNLRFSDNTGTGSVVFDRPISGTSATFGSLVTISSDGGGSALRLIGRAAADASAIRFFANNNTTQNARIESNSSALEINSISALPITFYTSDALRLTIASTGGATFNSTVGVGGASAINTFTVRAATNNNLDVFDNGTGVGIQSVNNINTAYRTLSLLGSSLSFTGAATFSSTIQATRLGIGNNVSGFGDIVLISNANANVYPRVDRSTTSNEAGWKYSTGGSDNWYIGLRSADNTGSYHFYSYTTNTSVAQITSGGNLLLGTISDNSRRLRVSQSSADYVAQISQLGSSGGSHGLTIDCNSSSSSIIGLEIYSTSASAFRTRLFTDGSATFSSSITANGGTYIPNGTYYYAQRSTGGANIGVLGFASGSDTLTIKGGTSGGSNSINFEDTGGIIASFFNGRLGIGTTSSPGTKLEVLSVAASADRTLPHNILTLTAEQGNAPYGPFGGAILFKNRSYVSGLVESSRIRSVIYDDGAPNNFGGGLWFETTPTPGGALTPSLIVNYQGRVGINTLNPDYRLQVNSPNAVLKLLSSGASFGSPSINMLQGSIDTVISATNNGLEIGTWSSHPIIFRVGSTGISEAMRITAGGVPGVKTVPTSGWGSSMAAIQVGTGGVLANWTGSNNNFSAGVNFYDNGAGSQLRLYNGGVSKIDFSENEIIFSNAVSSSANTSIAFTTRMRLQANGALAIGRTFGNSYSQTSTSGGTSIVDTGITYDTGDYGGYGRGATYQVVYVGNPNNAGSGAYFAQFVGILMVYTGWSGSAVTTYIQYNQIASGTNIGTLTLTPVFWNGSTESSSIGVYTGGAQIRLKISGYNSSWPGADQSVYLTRLT